MIKPLDIEVFTEREEWDPDNPKKRRGFIVKIKHRNTGIIIEKKGLSQPQLKIEALVELQERIDNMRKNKTGVFLARFQPLHNGHLYMIEKALEECERVVIVLGSSNKEGLKRNPFDLETRKHWLKSSLRNSIDYSRIIIFELPDWSTEGDHSQLTQWGHYLYYNIVSRVQAKHLNIYYSDDVSIINSWFDKEISSYITIINVDRSNVFDGLSATKIREAIKENNLTYLQKYCPLEVINSMKEMSTKLKQVEQDNKKDFSMK